MKAVSRVIAAAVIAASSLIIAAPPAAAGGCYLPKPSCTVYYKACSVASEVGITCID